MDANDIFEVFRAYRPADSRETTLVRVQDDRLHLLDNRKTVILVLLDLSAAFDVVDHRLLLDKLHESDIRDTAHRCKHVFHIFHSERKLLQSMTSLQDVLTYALVYRRVACWDPCFYLLPWAQPCLRTSQTPLPLRYQIPRCMLTFRVISHRMKQRPLTAHRDVPPM